MTGNRTMGASCHFPRVFVPSCDSSGLCCEHTHGRGRHKFVDSFILLYKHSNGKNRERKKVGLIPCMSLEQAPKGKSWIYTVAAILRKTCIAFISPLKCKCHFLLQRYITISKDLKPRNQHTTDALDHTFIFIFQSILALQDKNFISPAETQKPTANWNLSSALQQYLFLCYLHQPLSLTLY